MEPIKIRGLEQNNLKNISLDIPKNKIFDVVRGLKNVTVKAPVHIGDVIVSDIADTGVAVVATKNVDIL